MSTAATARTGRQVLVLAGTAGLHVGALVLIASGLLPRIAGPDLAPPPIRMVLPPQEARPRVAPDPVPAAHYSLPVEPMPQPPIPPFGEDPRPQAGSQDPLPTSGAGTTAVPPTDSRGPTLRTRDLRLAALIDSCYPSGARRLGQAGRVIVRIVIDAEGRPATWAVEQGSGISRLDTATDCVIRRLEFVAGRRDGRAVEAVALLPIVFRLH